MKLSILTFSPTGTSAKIAHAIARGTGIREVSTVDTTFGAAAPQTLGPDTLAVVAVPVYGGHVAPMAAKRLEQIDGQDTPAVAVVLYGNRHYEGALEELAGMLTGRGFRIIAAGTFIGEHSYSTPEAPIAAGRPDAQDLAFAEQFGRDIMQKLSQHPDAPAVDPSAIAPPTQDAGNMMKFKQTVMGWMQQGVAIPPAPLVDEGLCTGCGTCVDCCPAHAIPADAPSTTQADACIKCCACVKACPAGARTFPTPFGPLLHENFAGPKENRTLL